MRVGGVGRNIACNGRARNGRISRVTTTSPAWAIASLAIVALTFVAPSAMAYTLSAGDITAKAVMGGSVNMLRLDVATKSSPPGALIVGVDIDYALTSPIAVSAIVRSGVSAGYLDGTLGVGMKYRVTELDAPYIPYVSAHVVSALGAPISVGDIHWSLGARAAVGVDYFIMRNLAVGVEIGADTAFLVVPLPQVEISVDALFGVTWRF